jgi:hypothetical protein
VIPVTYSVPREKTSPLFCKAFATGCKGFVVSDGTLMPGPVAMFGSPALWEMLQTARREGRDYFYGDHAYFGRKQFYRITANAYQHHGIGETDGKRFKAFGRPVQPWRTKGSHVLVCPQSDTHFRFFGIDGQKWTRDVIAQIRQATDRPVRVRMKVDRKPIQDDLRDCWAVVTYSSASALDAMIAGVPVFVLADFAAAALAGLQDLSLIESPIYPDGRERFLGVLADNQWTLSEMSSGMAWALLREQAVMA